MPHPMTPEQLRDILAEHFDPPALDAVDWQEITRPSDHRRSDANRRYWHGKVRPMEEPGLIARLLGRVS